ncbi:MAG: tRNA (adenosine(37)-N6)-threonylcarbamoyltransferase complex dimerization subunit type 1 TsaB [Erysipelotrichaceae bacterium]|nr:tRNA (adenosine(37)-N6)-threonylcarbamoyltransferase complex dimerization subunit type 1 TsaB [Erysipelotrichaceae bacterium]
MITLFIDTSSSDVSIAIMKDKKILSNITKSIPNKHSIYTVSFIEQMIKEANLTVNDIEKIMVVTGPGSFTGVRIGVTIAKVYAYLKNLSIISISSLKMMSISCEHKYCLALIDAHHDNYYLGLYDENNQEIMKEQFNTKEKVLELIEKYQPRIVSNENIEIGKYKIKKQSLDISKIITYYQKEEPLNPHLVVPNYLKLPQALEEKHD